MFEHILVPLDGSSFGEAALRPAFALADRGAARLTLLNVQDLWAASPLMTYEAREEYLGKLRRDPRAGAARTRVVLRSGHPAAQIVEESETSAAGLIVMSTHGRGGVSRVWLGSVADQCMRHANVPILLVRPQPSERGSTGEALPPRIVVPLDGTVDAERSLPEATAVARAFGTPVVLLRAVEPGRQGASPITGEAPRAYLDGVAQRLWADGVQATTEVAIGRPAAAAILAVARNDLVVMSTHARSGISRALLGSVADKVVRGSYSPVLLVPPLRSTRAQPAGEGEAAEPVSSSRPVAGGSPPRL